MTPEGHHLLLICTWTLSNWSLLFEYDLANSSSSTEQSTHIFTIWREECYEGLTGRLKYLTEVQRDISGSFTFHWCSYAITEGYCIGQEQLVEAMLYHLFDIHVSKHSFQEDLFHNLSWHGGEALRPTLVVTCSRFSTPLKNECDISLFPVTINFTWPP